MNEWIVGLMSAASAAVLYKLLVMKIVIMESHVGLLYRHGKFIRSLKPGLHRVLRNGTHWAVTDLRKRVLTVPGQEIITSDNVSVKVSVLVHYSIKDPVLASHGVQNYMENLYASIQAALRASVGKVAIEEFLNRRSSFSQELLQAVAPEASTIGLEVSMVEIKDVVFPGELKKIFAEVVKAQKEGQAALERARAESAALRNLANAARLIENNPALMNLRVLQSLSNASSGSGNTFVMGLSQGLVPIEKGSRKNADNSSGNPTEEQAS